MQPRAHPFALLFALALAAGCSSRPRLADAIEAVVELDGGVTADCIAVAAWSGSAAEELSEKAPRTAQATYVFAVFPGGSLGNDVTLVARGYAGPACASLTAQSQPVAASFTPQIPRVTLVLSGCVGCGDGGADGGSSDGGMDAGGQDAGATDGGTPDGGPGLDAGADSGMGECVGRDSGDPCASGSGICTLRGACVPDFPYVPSNFGRPYPPIAPSLTFNCGNSGLDSTTPGAPPIFTNWCGQPAPPWVEERQDGGPVALVIAVEGVTVASGASLSLDGGRPVIFAVFGDATVTGSLLASAVANAPGPGGSLCTAGTGKDGMVGGNAAGGGGGGGFGTAGADGGPAAGGGNGGAPGTASANRALMPLTGGCGGGAGTGANPSAGGAGGGGLQLSAAGAVSVSGTVASAGGGGLSRYGHSGGAGGGSGGAVLLEGDVVTLSGAVTANGGGGGAGSGITQAGLGRDGAPAGTAPASGGNGVLGVGGNGGAGGTGTAAPGDGQGGTAPLGDFGGGGGGGGAVGILRFNAHTRCATSGATVSPAATSNGAPGCP